MLWVFASELPAANRYPVARFQTAYAVAGIPTNIVVSACDADGDQLTYAVVAGPAHGVVSNNGAFFTYTPQPGFSGIDTFTFRVADGNSNDIPAVTSIPLLETWRSNMLYYGETQQVKMINNDTAAWEAGAKPIDWIIVDSFYNNGIYYRIGDMTGCSAWYEAANKLAYAYRDGYVMPNNGAIPGYYDGADQLAVHYLRTGDPRSRAAVLALSQAMYGSDTATTSYRWDYSREVAFAMDNMMAAELVGGPRRARLAALADTAVTRQINEWFVTGVADYVKPFMVGLTAEALIRWHEQSDDPRVLPALKIAADWMWTNTWVASHQGFMYMSAGDRTPQPGLNQLISHMYAWVFRMTGDVSYRDQADQIFAGGVRGAWLSGIKEYNQNHRLTWNYINYRSFSANEAQVTVIVKSGAPIAHWQHARTSEDVAVPISLSGFDPGGLALSCSIEVLPRHGRLDGTAPLVTYVPETNFHGADSFVFKVSNGMAESVPAPVTITVTSVNDPPVAHDTVLSNAVSGPVAIVPAADDADGDSLTFVVASNCLHGSIAGSGTRSLVYFPVVGYQGGDWFSFRASDGRATGNTATVFLTVDCADNNRNGLPDWWEERYFGVLTDPRGNAADDWDGDGMSNAAEYRAGTDPTNAASAFRITSVSMISNSLLKVTWNGFPNRCLSVVGTSRCQERFSNAVVRINSTSVQNSCTINIGTNSGGFLRVVMDER